MNGKYDDIIDLPHHVSETRRHMPDTDRAAQFLPFAALSGYGDAITETGRLTDSKPELSDDEKNAINETLNELQKQQSLRPTVRIVYFLPDSKKEGGACVTVTAEIRRIDICEKAVVLADGKRIPFDDIISIMRVE